jgi:hypothetical protein
MLRGARLRPRDEVAMNRTLLAVLLLVALAAGGFFGWRAFSGGGEAQGGAVGAVTDALGSLAKKAKGMGAPDDSPVRCRVGKQMHFLRRIDCAQRQGEVVEGGSGAYTKLTQEEMDARFPKPAAAAPPAAAAEAPAP